MKGTKALEHATLSSINSSVENRCRRDKVEVAVAMVKFEKMRSGGRNANGAVAYV
jgi:hypothetical protein